LFALCILQGLHKFINNNLNGGFTMGVKMIHALSSNSLKTLADISQSIAKKEGTEQASKAYHGLAKKSAAVKIQGR
jgi:hypothetical protein